MTYKDLSSIKVSFGGEGLYVTPFAYCPRPRRFAPDRKGNRLLWYNSWEFPPYVPDYYPYAEGLRYSAALALARLTQAVVWGFRSTVSEIRTTARFSFRAYRSLKPSQIARQWLRLPRHIAGHFSDCTLMATPVWAIEIRQDLTRLVGGQLLVSDPQGLTGTNYLDPSQDWLRAAYEDAPPRFDDYDQPGVYDAWVSRMIAQGYVVAYLAELET